jgi:hypothetical protein
MKVVKVYLQLHVNLCLTTVNIIVKDAARIKEQVKGKAMMKLMIITKKHEGEISEMEKIINDVDGSSDTEKMFQ